MVRDEMDYLRRFTGDVAEGRGVWDYRRRMAAYGNAAWEAFWGGWLFGDQSAGREIRWQSGGTLDKCDDCLEFASRGWMPVRTFMGEVAARGYLPRSGYLECRGIHCLCTLQERVDGAVSPLVRYGA
jgi:hypothetical protein